MPPSAKRQAPDVSSRLSEYERKRDPSRTPEPFSRRGRGSEAPTFVVQRHDARRLHYDFRLERHGALASWAVPKGVPLAPGQQHLAVHVEDHPLDYASFEGEIPKGEYGAGTVEVWDRGTYELLEEKRDGGLTVRLEGERLRGIWALVPASLGGDPKNWLILRKRDDDDAVAGTAQVGIASYAPMLATLTKDVPRGAGWAFEVKWDGYRALVRVSGGEATLTSRNGHDLTARFAQVARAVEQAVRTTDCVLDGEVCALDEEGRSSFSAMQQGKPETPIVLYVFDVLEVEGESLVGLPFVERRKHLAALIDKRNRTVRLSETFEDGDALFAAAQQQQLEGIVAKRLDSRYRGSRSRDWLKIKTHGRQEFVIAGFTKGTGQRAASFGALVLGYFRDDELVYAGNVGTGFNHREIDRLLGLLRPLRRPTSPFRDVPKMPKVRASDVTWVEPELVCEVEFAEWTHDGRLRAPSYQGLREDKHAGAVLREDEPLPDRIVKGRRELKLSNLDKVFFPVEGITKGDLLEYYRAIAPLLVPHLKDRPFTMIRYPDGIEGNHFFQKDAPSHMPEWIETFHARVSTRESPRRRRSVDFPVVNDELALLWMVNMGCIDLNAWYSRVDRPERPDFVLFDLDPSPDVGFAETAEVALLVKQALDAFGLVGYPKTSSGEGMHVLVPVERRYSYADTREFAEIVARAIASTNRGLATTEWTKSKRRGVLIDANQNGEGKTIASVYSVRPRPGAPVSTPLRWDEVTPELDPLSLTMNVVRRRVRDYGDLFAGVLGTRQRIDRALKAFAG